MSMQQDDLFQAHTLPPALPEGFRYGPDLVSQEAEAEALAAIKQLQLRPFDFHGYQGKRRVASFGWKFDYDTQRIYKSEDIPAFLLPLREIAANFAGMPQADLKQALVTEYEPGAPIGWHRDKAVFGRVVGISLLSPCTFRLRVRHGAKWERYSLTAEPGSVYLLSGPARTVWEHSIPPVDNLRYSVTFRELA
ncbi:alpha-ketoglutarate-dependent dioxygenase AlkB [Rhizobium laguerreae]|uniref:alpha-ketoglutarate-dependent dioxygenase AlkB n=1 Tax=Rhizobium laguerreae TaxID=1076926 RepID=UPI001C91A013|nr:alpha-ketoglutarate-dependent dioxygenase AlkB [Rhizobium laguerreae]MBY3323803.1 alpha-ketoglutarate-dependent dioxygenase AlkB [Rhizobium laguerreae]